MIHSKTAKGGQQIRSSKENRDTQRLQMVGNKLDQHGSSSEKNRDDYKLRPGMVGNSFGQHGVSLKENY